MPVNDTPDIEMPASKRMPTPNHREPAFCLQGGACIGGEIKKTPSGVDLPG
jgi:hypothetical protein